MRALGLHASGYAWVSAVETALVQVVTAAVGESQSRGGEAVHVIRMLREAKSLRKKTARVAGAMALVTQETS